MNSELKKRDDESKRSVFDRLGPDTKSTSANYPSSISKISIKMPSVCPSYAKTGYCQLGSKCKYEHAKKEKEKEDIKSKNTKKDIEKTSSHSKEHETKLKSAIIFKASEDSDKKFKKVAEDTSKSLKQDDRSPSPGLKKRRGENVDQIKHKDKKSSVDTSREEYRNDQKHSKIDEKIDKLSSSRNRTNDQLSNARNSSSSSKRTEGAPTPPPSSKEQRSSETKKHRSGDATHKSQAKSHGGTATISKARLDASRGDVALKREVLIAKKEEGDSKEKKDDGKNSASSHRIVASSKPDQKQGLKSAEKKKETSKSKTEAKTSRRQRSASESSSSSSSTGSSSSSSGSSSGSSSSSSTRAKSPLGKKKHKVDAKKTKVPDKLNADWCDKNATKAPQEEAKQTPSTKNAGDLKSREKAEKRTSQSKKAIEASQDVKRGFSESTSSRYASPEARGRDEAYYSSRRKEDKYSRSKMAEPDFERERCHESRRVKIDRYDDRESPAGRRKEADYYRGDSYRYRRGEDDDYERRSRERSAYELQPPENKEPAHSDEPMRRERLSRKGQWEQFEADDLSRCKHKRHLSEESFSPQRKKKRLSPTQDDFRVDKLYEPDGRKRELERDDDSLMGGEMGYKQKHRRRSSPESWHQHSKERRSRRDKSERDRSRERTRDGFYARSPLESGDFSPRHRPVADHGKRSGDYSGYDYDIDRGRRSVSRSSMGSKAAGRSRYYEGKRSLVGSVMPSHHPGSYEYRDSYRATPDADVGEGDRAFPGKPFWDDYKRTDAPSSGTSYRGVPTHSRAPHAQSASSGVPQDWDAGRVSGKQQQHDWDSRYERSSEEFGNRRDVLLPPPPRPRQENSDVQSPALTTTSNQNEATDAEVLKSMKFEMEGYEEITEEELDECISEDVDEAADKEENQSTCEEEAEILPKRIPLVDMSDIEWETLVKADESKSNELQTTEQKFSDIIREIGVSRRFAGDELFEKINNLLAESDDDLEGEEEEEVDDDINAKGGRMGKVDKPGVNHSADKSGKVENISTNGLAAGTKIEPKENGEEASTAVDATQSCHEEKGDPNEGRHMVGGSPEEKENHIKVETFGDDFAASKTTASALKANKKKGPLLHDVANFHVTAFLKQKRQSSAMRDIGPYRRALCARRDLLIRRTLCKIEKEEIVMFPAQLADQELYKLSLQLFHQTSKALQENLPVQHTLA